MQCEVPHSQHPARQPAHANQMANFASLFTTFLTASLALSVSLLLVIGSSFWDFGREAKLPGLTDAKRNVQIGAKSTLLVSGPKRLFSRTQLMHSQVATSP